MTRTLVIGVQKEDRKIGGEMLSRNIRYINNGIKLNFKFPLLYTNEKKKKKKKAML
jgi:hypothetical protein